jgi:hypothetical protein
MSRNYRDEIAKLAPLDMFDSRAFQPLDKADKDACHFVLALALAFNDLKDLLLAHSIAIADAPSDQTAVTRERGASAGTHLHFVRMTLGYLYELLSLIQNNAGIRSSQSLGEVVKRLGPRSRKAWDKIAAVADGDEREGSDDDIRLLRVARNRAAYHYDPSAIGKGYRDSFIPPASETPYVSRGNSIATTRFYFADRASQAFLTELLGQPPEDFFLQKREEFLSDIGVALYMIVTTFAELRGATWKRA